MTATMSSNSSKGLRYAPVDPTLPKPWKGLVDGNTGYLYFWNPETNVTQYERPAPPPLPSQQQTSVPKSSSVTISSSVQVHSGQHESHDADSCNDRSQSYQNQVGHELYRGHSAPNSGGPAARHGSSDIGGGSCGETYRCQHEITVTGVDVPNPYMKFELTGFPSEILRELRNAGFSVPTPIQAQSWPIALESRDIVAVAKTGSGKTLGYLLPGFIHLKRLHNDSKMGPTVLVLSPTRELATQIQDEAVKFGRSSRISCMCLYGGAPKGPQLRDLDRGVDVVIATPGRLNDILKMRRVSLRQVSYLVLDEADRMLDMGFEPQIRTIVNEIPPRRQTLMFTATWPKEVRKIAADLLVNPVQVNIGNIDELVANKSITQYVEVMTSMEKQLRLEQILRTQEPGSKIIIFCSTKRMCDQLARTLTRQFGAAAIHGDKSQSERDSVLGEFRSGRSPILVATDVAARGLDVKDIRVVINYDFPTGVEDYVHRIGRTGRAGATGLAYTFFCDRDSKYASDLVKVLEGASQSVPQELRDMVSCGGYGGRSSRWGSGSGSYGGGCRESSYGGRCGRGPPPYLGRSVSSHGSWGHDQESSYDRYNPGNQGLCDDTKGIMVANNPRGGGRGESCRLSPDRGPGGWGNSRSRSRSPNGSCHFNRYRGAGGSVPQQQSPLLREPSPAYQQQQRSPSYSNRSGRVAQLSPSTGFCPEGSHSPNKYADVSMAGSQWRSPPPPYIGEEEEEGMIPAEDENGKVFP